MLIPRLWITRDLKDLVMGLGQRKDRRSLEFWMEVQDLEHINYLQRLLMYLLSCFIKIKESDSKNKIILTVLEVKIF